MDFEKKIADSINGLLKSKKNRVESRNNLLSYISSHEREVEEILNKSDLVSWKDLINTVLNHDRMEIDINLNSTHQANFAQIPTLLLPVLNLQFMSGSESSLKNVIHHITEQLLSPNECTVNFVGKSYLHILDATIISNHKIRCDLTQDKWNMIYKCMCSLQANPPPHFLNEVSRIFLHLVDLGRGYSTVPASLILNSLSPVLSDLLDNKKSYFINLFTSFNLVTEHSGVNCRALVCRIGEEIFDSVHVFLINPIFQQMTIQILKFFILQFHFHHPSDTIEPKYITKSWIRSVNKLHQIMLELFQMQKNIFSKLLFYNNGFSQISQILFSLLVQVIRAFHLIEMNFPDLDISFSSLTKKVKLSSTNFLELLSEQLSLGFNRNTIAFIHLFRRLLDRLPHFFKGRIPAFIKNLCEIISTASSNLVHDITTEVLHCFIAIVSNPDLIQDANTQQELFTNISHHHIQFQKEPLFYKLLALYLEFDNLIKLPIVWSEFRHSLCFADAHSIAFLWQYISIRDLPSCKDISLRTNHPPLDDRNSNRMCILNCLLPERIDNNTNFVHWLVSCDHFFMLGQILASLSMRSCRKPIRLTKRFVTDSSLRNNMQNEDLDIISDDVLSIMLELEFLPFSPRPTPPDLELYTTKPSAIPEYHSEYISRTNKIFFNLFTHLTASETSTDNKAVGIISLLKYYFYFQFNLIIWSSYHTNPAIPSFQIELTTLVFNQYCEYIMQSPGSIYKLEDFFTEVRIISDYSEKNALCHQNSNNAINSLLKCVPMMLVNNFKSHILHYYKIQRQQDFEIPLDTNPFHTSLLNETLKQSLSRVRVVCNLHWLAHRLNSDTRDCLENFLVEEILSIPLEQLYAQCPDKIFVLHADFTICEYFAAAEFECSHCCLTSILQILLVTCTQLHKFNPTSISKIISILTSLAHRLIEYIKSDQIIPHLVENLLRILTQMYLSSRLTSQNKIAYIKLIFLFYHIFSDSNWPLLTLQATNSEGKTEKTLKILIYKLNIDLDALCIVTYAHCIGKLHSNNTIDLDYHLDAFFHLTKSMNECNLPTLLAHNLMSTPDCEHTSQYQLNFPYVLLVRLALCSSRLSSSLVAYMLSFTLEKGVDKELIVRALSRISVGLSYSDLSNFFSYNYESIFIEWLCLGMPIRKFPFELFCATEQQYVEEYLKKWAPLTLLANDEEANAFLIELLPQVESNEDLLKYSLSEISHLVLLPNPEDIQLPLSVLKSHVVPFSRHKTAQAKDCISNHLPLKSRRKLLKQNLESILLNFFSKCLYSYSINRKKEIESLLPPFFGTNIDISFINEAFKNNFNVSLFSFFESDPYLLPRMHISILKGLIECVQPYQFIRKLYYYCTFLQLITIHSSPTFETLTFLLNDSVYILFDFLRTSTTAPDSSILHIKRKFSNWITHPDTLTLLHTLISIYKSVLPHIPDLVLNTVSILTDVLCDYACSEDADISSLSLNSLGSILTEIRDRKAFAILIFIPSNPVLTSLKSSIEDWLGDYSKVAILRELAVNSWYSLMSSLSYLNQVKLHLTWFINSGSVKLCNVKELNLLFDQLIQKIHYVIKSNCTQHLETSVILFEIFVLLTPYYNRCRLAVECESLAIYSKPLKLHHALYHIPILLSPLSKLIHSSDIQLKELAYNVFNAVSNTNSVQNVIQSLEKASVFSYSSFPFTSSLAKKTRNITKSAHTPTETSRTIPFEIQNENTIENTRIWLKDLCLHLVDNCVQDPILMSTRPILLLHYESAKEFLKLFVYDVILGENFEMISTLSDHFNNGFKQAFDYILHHSNENRVNVHSIRILLELVHFLRRRSLFDNSPRGYFKNNFLLKVNHLYAASSSFFCKDYHSTLLFLDIYLDPLRNVYLTLSPIPSEELVIQELLIKTYGELGERECVKSVACNSLNLEFQKAKMTGNWPEVIQMCSSFPFNQVSSTLDLCEAMHRMGWYSFSRQQVSEDGDASLSDLNFESVWRLSLWDDNLPEVLSTNPAKPSPQEIILENIQAFKERDISYVRNCIDSNAHWFIADFFNCTEGSIFNISKLLANISILKTLSDFSIFTDSVLACKGNNAFPTLPSLIAPKDFTKDILSIRISLLSKIVDFLEFEEFCDEVYLKQLFELIFNDVIIAVKLARQSNQGSEANNILHALELCLNKMVDSLPCVFALEFNFKIKFEYAKVKFLQKDFHTCFSILKDNSIFLDLNQFPEIYCYLLTLYGTFLGEKQQETSLNIISQYLERSVLILGQLHYDLPSSGQIKLLEKAYFSLAQYTDKQYNLIVEYMDSPEYGTKKKLTHTFEQMAKLDLGSSEKQVQLPLEKGQRQANKHASEYHKQNSELFHDKSEFLMKALESYCNCLELTDAHDLSISRVISLWFDNHDIPVISQLLANHFSNINSHKFIPWVFQIIPRLSFISSDANPVFSNTLTSLIMKITREHPYHCLPIIFSILHSSLDLILSSKKEHKYGDLAKSIYNVKSPLKDIVEILEAEKGEIVQRMRKLFIDLVDLGYHNYNLTKATKTVELSRNCFLLTESNVRDLPVLTLEIPVSHNSDYSHLTTIVKFNSRYSVPGGVTLPKLLTCLGSNGETYRILLKGREDLRKDAVIQQAFTVINQLLAQDKWFSEKCIGIRTYKIVPLSQGSGLISWCEGAISLAAYLIHNSGAHQRYHPHDEKSETCDHNFRLAPNKLKSYRAICERFHPVFRFFFFEKFLDAATWFQRRVQYTRSVAVASMAGYILGIGDRHTENILIDTSTAEIIHIDFGELFDSGKLLTVPEMVPFRLTRDIVDPMGDLGKDGLFRPCCEETLRIIRISKEYIKTVLKVLLYAPLNKWEIMQNCIKSSLTKQNAENSQMNYSPSLSLGGEDANRIALRVLLRINEKIDGIESRTPLSISGQVNLLISEATDEVNLSSMYHGWKPWV